MDHVDVLWTTYRCDDMICAVADVPRSIPADELGFGANGTEVSLFVGSPRGPQWTVALPDAVNPMPTAVSYNNGVFEAVFEPETGG